MTQARCALSIDNTGNAFTEFVLASTVVAKVRHTLFMITVPARFVVFKTLLRDADGMTRRDELTSAVYTLIRNVTMSFVRHVRSSAFTVVAQLRLALFTLLVPALQAVAEAELRDAHLSVRTCAITGSGHAVSRKLTGILVFYLVCLAFVMIADFTLTLVIFMVPAFVASVKPLRRNANPVARAAAIAFARLAKDSVALIEILIAARPVVFLLLMTFTVVAQPRLALFTLLVPALLAVAEAELRDAHLSVRTCAITGSGHAVSRKLTGILVFYLVCLAFVIVADFTLTLVIFIVPAFVASRKTEHRNANPVARAGAIAFVGRALVVRLAIGPFTFLGLACEVAYRGLAVLVNRAHVELPLVRCVGITRPQAGLAFLRTRNGPQANLGSLIRVHTA